MHDIVKVLTRYLNMRKFPTSLLEPKIAVLSGQPHDASLDILLEQFILDEEVINAQIRLDGIEMPSLMLADLVGKSFAFPINPEDGYIDGSIYMDSAHHPVDVDNISFHLSRDETVTMVLKGVLDFEFEKLRHYEKTPFSLGVTVATCAL